MLQSRKFTSTDVWNESEFLDNPTGHEPGDYNYSLSLDCPDKAFILTGRKNGTLCIIDTENREKTANWVSIHGSLFLLYMQMADTYPLARAKPGISYGGRWPKLAQKVQIQIYLFHGLIQVWNKSILHTYYKTDLHR
jgi:hypothetical protein